MTGRQDGRVLDKTARSKSDRSRQSRGRASRAARPSSLDQGRDWLLGAAQGVLRFRARIAEHYREQIYDRLNDAERESERLEADTAEPTDGPASRRAHAPTAALIQDRVREARRYATQWWEDYLRFRARQVDNYIELLHARSERLRELRSPRAIGDDDARANPNAPRARRADAARQETTGGEGDPKAPKAKVAATANATAE
jgi:hypothetical protein